MSRFVSIFLIYKTERKKRKKKENFSFNTDYVSEQSHTLGQPKYCENESRKINKGSG